MDPVSPDCAQARHQWQKRRYFLALHVRALEEDRFPVRCTFWDPLPGHRLGRRSSGVRNFRCLMVPSTLRLAAAVSSGSGAALLFCIVEQNSALGRQSLCVFLTPCSGDPSHGVLRLPGPWRPNAHRSFFFRDDSLSSHFYLPPRSSHGFCVRCGPRLGQVASARRDRQLKLEWPVLFHQS